MSIKSKMDFDKMLEIAGAIWIFSLISYLVKCMIDKFWGGNDGKNI